MDAKGRVKDEVGDIKPLNSSDRRTYQLFFQDICEWTRVDLERNFLTGMS